MRLIGWVPANQTRVVHRVGLPSQGEPGQTLPPASLLIIDEETGGARLLRYALSGEFAGDTWHLTADAAKEQARFEFGAMDWQEDEATSHVDRFAAARLRARSSDST